VGLSSGKQPFGGELPYHLSAEQLGFPCYGIVLPGLMLEQRVGIAT